MKLSVYKIDGTESGKQVELDEKVFGITPNVLSHVAIGTNLTRR